MAIVTALTLRTVFHLAFRQTEGFVGPLIRVLGLLLDAPDHSTLSRRNRTVRVPRLAPDDAGPLHLAIDSTGLKLCGSGEWQAHQHGTSGQRHPELAQAAPGGRRARIRDRLRAHRQRCG